MLNIRAVHGLDDEEDDDLQRYRSTVQKEWAKFGEIGFQDVDSAKLEFDLTESEREASRRKRDTLDWSTFETAGFAGREMFAPTDLVFHQNIGQRVTTWPSSQKDISQRLREAEKALPPFPYDTTPYEEGRVKIDALFFEAWADVLVGGGWARDELKESNFALIHWKSRPRDVGMPLAVAKEEDPRTEERWFLVEEYVPKQYREALLVDPNLVRTGFFQTDVRAMTDRVSPLQVKKTSKRSSFLRSVRRRSGGGVKDAPLPPTPPQQRSAAGFDRLTSAPLSSSHGRSRGAHHLSPIDEAVFSSNNHETQTMSLSPRKLSATEARGPAKPRQSESTAPSVYTTQGTFASRPYAPSTAYAPSVVSTVQATNDHAGASTVNLPAAQTGSVGAADRPSSPPRTPAYPTHEPEPAVGATASRSTPGLGLPPALGPGPVGKKGGGLMARIGTARKVSGDKIVKFFNNNTHKDEPATATSSIGGGISAFLRDTKPGLPPLGPVLGAATSAATPPPPPPPKKSDDSASVLARSAPGTPSLEAAAEFDSAAANAYDGLASPTEEGFPASTNNGHGDASAEKETLSTSQQVSGVLSVPRFCLC